MTQVEIAKHLDLSERKLREFLKKNEIDHKNSSLDSIRILYIRKLREVAAGRNKLNEGGINDYKKKLIGVQIKKEKARLRTLMFDLHVKKKRFLHEDIERKIQEIHLKKVVIEQDMEYFEDRLRAAYNLYEVLGDCLSEEEKKGNLKEIDRFPYYEATWMNKPE